jgi:hypothetical protein
MKNFYSDLPTWAKGVVAVVSIVAIGGIGFAIYRGVKKAIDRGREGKEDKDFKEEINQELKDLAKQGVSPTLSDAQAISLANLVENSLSGCELSGTEENVYKAIAALINNQADWLKLQNVYGIRETDNCGFFTGNSKQDLKGILMSDLDGFDLTFTTYATQLRKNLEAKGITF